MGNNHYLMRRSSAREPRAAKGFVAWLLGATKGYAAEAGQPRRRRDLEEPAGGNVSDWTSTVDHFDVTPRQIIEPSPGRPMNSGCPTPFTFIANNLGLPGNWTTTLATMKLLEGHRGHIDPYSVPQLRRRRRTIRIRSTRKVVPLAEYVNAHPNLTVDVGQVMFGETTSMTGDGPLGYYLSKVYKSKWFSSDTEMEAGCGMSPIDVQKQEPGPRPAMGHRAGVVSAGRRSVAGGDEHRPSQRRLIFGVSRNHPAADGPHLSAGHACTGCTRNVRERCVAGRSGSRIHSQRNLPSSPGVPGAF